MLQVQDGKEKGASEIRTPLGPRTKWKLILNEEERDMKEARRMELELLSWKGIHAEQSHRHRNKEGRCETARIILDVKGEM